MVSRIINGTTKNNDPNTPANQVKDGLPIIAGKGVIV
jgi:hypothetical protein